MHLCEYGAQAAAVHGGLSARSAGTAARPGLLVSLRDVDLSRDYIEDLEGELIVEAERLMQSTASWQYAFVVRHADDLIARGRAAIMAR
jgi:predicted hotdog family 3-hydroxylacyl-ACP dehydratase